MKCNKCGGPMTTAPSDFPGWDLLQCADCGRPVRLVQPGAGRVRLDGPKSKAEINRALRAARRFKARKA